MTLSTIPEAVSEITSLLQQGSSAQTLKTVVLFRSRKRAGFSVFYVATWRLGVEYDGQTPVIFATLVGQPEPVEEPVEETGDEELDPERLRTAPDSLLVPALFELRGRYPQVEYVGGRLAAGNLAGWPR